MQIDLSTALALFSTLASLAFGAWFATAKYAFTQRENEIDRRLEDSMRAMATIDQRLNVEEKSTIRQDGELQRVKDASSHIESDIEEIKRTMVTKAEMQSIERLLNQMLAEMKSATSRSGTSGRYGAFPYASTDPPKKRDP
jgi:chromosome segregation ATPase